MRITIFIIISFISGLCSFLMDTALGAEKSSWHGFDRYDYVINEKTLKLTPITATPQEGTGVATPEPGTRRCIVVVPKQALAGNPWTWRGCYWDHEPQTEIALLNKGYHVAFITTDPDKTWDAWYNYLIKEYRLSPKPAFIGMSRGGSNAYTWGTANPDKVTAIYADNPGVSQASLTNLYLLAQYDVPLLNVCGSVDPIINNTRAIENIYHAFGGRISVLVKDGPAHHPHSLKDPEIIVNFIEQSYAAKKDAKPSYLPLRYTRTSFYNTQAQYVYSPADKVWTTRWGPQFTGSYNKYTFSIPEGVRVTVIAPEKATNDTPWVYRCDQPSPDSEVDFALLARGFHIVVGPVPTSADGPNLEDWNKVYAYLTEKGFSKKPVVAGRGAATGEVYQWAIENPEKVSAIYGENPILRSSLAKVQPIDNLGPLAKARIPIIHVCGGSDPNLDSQTHEVEKIYKQLGGQMTVIVDKDRGHYPLSPDNTQLVADFIALCFSSQPTYGTFREDSKFYFDGSISREVLENYLDRSVTAGYFLVAGTPENYLFPFKEDDIRMIENIGAKFIGRAIYRWSEESKLGEPAFLDYAKRLIDRMHEYDPEMIFQGCLFEHVSGDVNNLKIPAWVFEAFGLPVEDRNFRVADMIKRANAGSETLMRSANGGTPMIHNIESQFWFYYLAKSYIDIGCEAFHLGQVELIGRDDPDKTHYAAFLQKVRAYAKAHARRHYVLLDGHTPKGGFVKDGVSLLDFNSFPLRVKEVIDKPMEGILEVGNSDGIFQKSQAAISPSGWKAEHMPYLVEFDNFGISRNPGVANQDPFCWGYDDITWFAMQDEDYRNKWLWYAFDWLRKTDPNGHLQMCVIRMISGPLGEKSYRSYFANTKSVACPVGYSQEETIKELWNIRLK